MGNILSEQEVERITWRYANSDDVKRLCESHGYLNRQVIHLEKIINHLRDELERKKSKPLELEYR